MVIPVWKKNIFFEPCHRFEETRNFFLLLLYCAFLITFKILSPTNALFLKYKTLQLTLNLSLCRLLHVSVRSDHHQGAYAEPC
jgi:hypothetical protein